MEIYGFSGYGRSHGGRGDGGAQRHGHGRCGEHGGWARGKAFAMMAGGMRRRRMFDGGELRLVLLKLIADSPRHGYELIKAIEEITGGGYAPSPGVIYPTLTMLGETGHVSGEAVGDGRKRFSITDAGRTELAENEAQVQAVLRRLSSFGERHQRIDAKPVRRAMANLKVALQDRLSRDGTSDEILLQAAALIDEAAHKIERLG